MFHSALRTGARVCRCAPALNKILTPLAVVFSPARHKGGKRQREYMLNLRREAKARQSVAEETAEGAEGDCAKGKGKGKGSRTGDPQRDDLEFMTVDIEDPAKKARITQLLEYFPKKDIAILASACPQIFTQDMDDVVHVMEYISTKMGLDQGDMVQAGAFDYPLEHIVKRHLFLERAGVFKLVGPKKREAYLMLNPPLRKILRSSDKQFSQLSGLTLEEYHVFSDMFAAQKHKLVDYIAEGKNPALIEDELEDERAKEEDLGSESEEVDRRSENERGRKKESSNRRR